MNSINQRDIELHVIFGTGPLGKWTMRELVKQKKKVRIVNRSGNRAGIPDDVEVMAGNAFDSHQVAELTKGAKVVYQCAQPAYQDWVELFPLMQQAIVEGVSANGARLVVAENLYMYGMPSDTPFHEDTPYRAHTRKGKIRQAMTEALDLTYKDGKLLIARVRGSDFWGPDDFAGTPLIFGPFLTGKRGFLMGNKYVPHTFTYVPDFGKALALVGTNVEAFGQIWHVPSNPPVSQAELHRLIAEETKRSIKTISLSKWMLGTLGLFNPVMRVMEEMIYQWKHPFIMDSNKFMSFFQMQPTPIQEAVRHTVNWYRLEVEKLQKRQ